jgi:hypothetical protein
MLRLVKRDLISAFPVSELHQKEVPCNAPKPNSGLSPDPLMIGFAGFKTIGPVRNNTHECVVYKILDPLHADAAAIGLEADGRQIIEMPEVEFTPCPLRTSLVVLPPTDQSQEVSIRFATEIGDMIRPNV